MKKIIFGIVIGIILCSGIVYGVNLYKSEDIQYQPSDAGWEVSNVSDALNDLYSNSSSETVLIASSKSKPFNYTVKSGRYLIVAVGGLCKSSDNNMASHTLTIDGIVTSWDYVSEQKNNAASGSYFARTNTAYKMVEVNSTINITSNASIVDFLVYKIS